MDINIQWRNISPLKSKESIQKVENYFGITFPKDYTDFIINHNEGQPYPKVISTNTLKGEVLDLLLGFNEDDITYIISTYDNIKDRLVDRVFPFADDPFGNTFCFDYRSGDVPVIVFWDHEQAYMDKEKGLTYVCDTFTELINSLHEPEDE